MRDERTELIVRAVAGFALPGSRVPERQAVNDIEWGRLFHRIRWERISGLAVECVADGWLDLTDGQLDELLGVHREAMAWSLTVERKLVGLAGAFESEGIRFVVLKGASVAHTAYADPGLRSFADLDLLVQTDDYVRTCGLLRQLGHVRQRPEPRPRFEVRFGKASVHEHPEDLIQVDLHRTLVLGPFGLWLRPDELFERETTFDLAGRDIPRLDDTAMLVNVAMHASLGWRPPRLAALRDVVEVSHNGRVEWDLLREWSSRWRLTGVLQHAFGAASDVFGVTLPEDASSFADASVSDRERRALLPYVGERRRMGGIATGTIRAIPGIRGKAAYVWALAVPSREFLAARAVGSNASYLRRLKKPAGWVRDRLSGSNGRRGNTGATAGGGR